MINEAFQPQRTVRPIGGSATPEASYTNRSAPRTLALGFALVAAIACPRAADAQMNVAMGSLPMGVPDLCAMPTVSAKATGLWSAPGTWSTGAVPSASARVAIPPGLRVTYDLTSDTALYCVGVHGTLAYRANVSSRLVVGTLFVYSDGALEIGTAAAPVAASALAELVIADQALDLLADPEQFGTGLVAFGRVTMYGVPKAATFVRLASEVAQGNTQLAPVSAVADWAVGDRVVVPDTRHLKAGETKLQYLPQWEERVLTSVSPTALGVSRGFDFLHEGARNGDGVLEILPHVANLSRNVLIRSANPAGTRGHMIAIGRANVDIRYARFLDLGRTTTDPLDSTTLVNGVATHVGTNQLGRYSLHMHHLSGPLTPQASGAQFTLIGNAIEASRKWGIAIHHSNYGLVKHNIVYNARGVGVMFEDGSESFNTVDSNFVMRVVGVGGRGDDRGAEFGFEGTAYWFRGPNNYVRKNVAANITAPYDGPYGYKFFQLYLGNIQVPRFQGADVSTTTDMQTVDGHGLPIREFSDNEAYGATESGLTLWWVGTFGTDGQTPGIGYSEIKGFRAWHVYDAGIYNYPTHRILITDLVVRGKDPLTTACCATGYFAGDYMASDLVIDRADIQGMRTGISLSTHSGGVAGGTQSVRNSYLRNHTNVTLGTMFTSGYRADWIPARHVVFANVRMGAWDTGWSGAPVGDYVLGYSETPTRTLIQLDDIEVVDHNGLAGDSFRLFYTQQAPNFIVPQTMPNTDGSPKLAAAPVAGLTNTQTWSQYGIAIAGAIAPCASLRSRMVGAFACGGSLIATPPSPLPPPPPSNAAPSISVTSPRAGDLFTAPATITLQATAADSDGTVTRVDYFAGTTPIGSSTSGPTYTAIWSGVAAGTYNVTARATDNGGATTTSGPVMVTVRSPNAPPSVSVGSPRAVDLFTAPATITLQATAADSGGTVTRVDYFTGTTPIGSSTSGPTYTAIWSGVAAGTYSVTARATDNGGATKTSTPVVVTVKPASGGGSSAVFVRADATTQGTWRGVYGANGYTQANGASSLPAYATVTLTGQLAYTWVPSTTSVRALQRPTTTDRFAATWYSGTTFSIDVNLTDGLTHRVAVYAIDWDTSNARAQRIDVVDAISGAVLDSRTLTAYKDGQYLVWNLRGHVTLRVTRTTGANAVFSALMID